MSTDRIADALVSADLAESRGDVSRLSADQTAALDRARLRLAGGDATAAHVVSTILDRRVRMPLYRWDAAVHAFDLLARKAAERGLPVPSIEEIERETNGEGEHTETWVVARILGAAPVLDGWRCVATLTEIADYDENAKRIEGSEQIVTHVADGETFDGEGAMRCDHCGFNRRRHLVFVLRHEDGREMLVGSTCLNEYLGTDALGAWFVWSRLHEISERLGGYLGWDWSEHAQWLANQPEAITRKDTAQSVPLPLADYIASCVAEIREHGYVSRSQAWRERDSDEGPSAVTGSKVWTAVQDGTHIAPTSDDFARAEEIIAWIDTLDRYDFDQAGDLRYTSSLAQALDSSVRTGVHSADANMLASSVTAYERELSRRAADAQWTDAHVPGAEGDAVVLDLVVRRSLGWAFACADVQGRQVVVRAHTYKSDAQNIAVGDEIRVSGTLSRFGEYRGVKQTMLSRPSVYHRTDDLTPAIRKKAAAMFDRLGEPVPEWAQAKKKSRKK